MVLPKEHEMEGSEESKGSTNVASRTITKTPLQRAAISYQSQDDDECLVQHQEGSTAVPTTVKKNEEEKTPTKLVTTHPTMTTERETADPTTIKISPATLTDSNDNTSAATTPTANPPLDYQEDENNSCNNYIAPPPEEPNHPHDHDRNNNVNNKTKRMSRRDSQYVVKWRAFQRSLLQIDYTKFALVPGLRTSLILMLEWAIFGIGTNHTTTYFQLGCLYVGFTDPNGSLGMRLEYMGLTLLCCVAIGACLPGLLLYVDQDTWITVGVSFVVAWMTGYSLMLKNSAALFQAMKLGTTLFAIHNGIHQTSTYNHPLNSDNNKEFEEEDLLTNDELRRHIFREAVLYTFFGGAVSLAAAILPDVIGNRDAIRTSLFQMWYGFGMDLIRWNGQWGSRYRYIVAPTPIVTLSISSTEATIKQSTNITAAASNGCSDAREQKAREWLLKIVRHAGQIRVSSLCLSNVYHNNFQASHNHSDDDMERSVSRAKSEQRLHSHQQMDDFFLAQGRFCRSLAFALQFPWMVRYIPFLQKRLTSKLAMVRKTASAFIAFHEKQHRQSISNTQNTMSMEISQRNGTFHGHGGDEEHVNSKETSGTATSSGACLASLVHVIEREMEIATQLVQDASSWPPYSSPHTLAAKFCAAFPSSIFPIEWQGDPTWAIRGYAIRFALAFSIATILDLFTGAGNRAHWIPMTVALIMGPTHATAYEKVLHRTVGTLLGLGLGSALVPLFQHPAVLTLLLGANTFAVVVFIKVNYAIFTLFITAWVYVTIVGVGAPIGTVTLWRCIWTLVAGLLVVVMMYIYPPKANYDVGHKLAAMATAVKVYAETVVKEHDLLQQQQHRRRSDEEGNVNNDGVIVDDALHAASEEVEKARATAAQSRIAMFTTINEAVLAPTEGYVVDPHSLAPSLASDLVNAVVIPQAVAIIKTDGGADTLLCDMNRATFSEIDRLALRLEKNGDLTADSSTQEAKDDEESPAQETTNTTRRNTIAGQGLFSDAIARAHGRLNEAGIPSHSHS